MNFNLKVNTIRIILSLNINKNFFNKLISIFEYNKNK